MNTCEQEIKMGSELLIKKCQIASVPENYIVRELLWYKLCMNPRYVQFSSTENVSDVVDRLLRITTRLTEFDSCSILNVIQKLNAAIEEGQPFATLLLFSDSGVISHPVGFKKEAGVPYVVMHKLFKKGDLQAYQTWLLAYAPGDMPNECFTLLQRVEVNRWKKGFLV